MQGKSNISLSKKQTYVKNFLLWYVLSYKIMLISILRKAVDN